MNLKFWQRKKRIEPTIKPQDQHDNPFDPLNPLNPLIFGAGAVYGTTMNTDRPEIPSEPAQEPPREPEQPTPDPEPTNTYNPDPAPTYDPTPVYDHSDYLSPSYDSGGGYDGGGYSGGDSGGSY